MTSYLPSPTVGVWHLGPLPVRMYALCILIGIVVAVWLTGRRLVPRGGEPGQALDVAAWAVLFGIVGGRLYHVITTPGPYWGEGGLPVDALKIAIWSTETLAAHVALGDVLLRLRDVDGAGRAADRALALDPADADALALAARVRAARAGGAA